MRVKGHGTIKTSKAYGAIGTLLLSGVLFLVRTSGAYADEAQPNAAVDSVQIDGNLSRLFHDLQIGTSFTSLRG